MIDKLRLKEKAETYGIGLTQEMLERCEAYARLIDAYNEKINITAITKPDEVEDKHFLDCFLLANQPEVTRCVADIGSGAGFPGLVIKIYKPDIEMTLIESNKKKTAFLSQAAQALSLKVRVLEERAEDLARAGERERYDVVTARAVAALPALCEYGLPLVRVGGWFIPMKGKKEEEKTEAQRAVQILGGAYGGEREYILPDGSIRKLWLIEKKEATPAKYPRNTAQIKKRSL